LLQKTTQSLREKNTSLEEKFDNTVKFLEGVQKKMDVIENAMFVHQEGVRQHLQKEKNLKKELAEKDGKLKKLKEN